MDLGRFYMRIEKPCFLKESKAFAVIYGCGIIKLISRYPTRMLVDQV